MATDNPELNPASVPFLFRFAEPIPEAPLLPVRYDGRRQLSQVLVDGRWVDSPDVSVEVMRATRFTRVARETSDDE
jgi:hypothetical protein